MAILHKYISIILLIALASAYPDLCAKTCSMNLLSGRVWVHSHEEDTDAVKVYRPSTFSFPLSRGRDKFQFQKDGTLIIYSIGRSDRLNEIHARWKKISVDTFRIRPDNSAIPPFDMKVISCANDIVSVQK